MQKTRGLMIELAKKLLQEGAVDRVIGWKREEDSLDNTPASFTLENVDGLVYDRFCGINLSKYAAEALKQGGRALIFLKPCDSRALNLLISENKIARDNVVAVAVGCDGHFDKRAIEGLGVVGVKSVCEKEGKVQITGLYGDIFADVDDILLKKCASCASKKFALCDYELTDFSMREREDKLLLQVKEIEELDEEQRFEFWREQLSKCIRCNACRQVCPACTCVSCVFDNDRSTVANKVNANAFEENLYHIIRAYHVAGRCVDCGECGRVCPQSIPLQLLHKKTVKDLALLYGEGCTDGSRNALTAFSKEDGEVESLITGGKR